MSIELVSGQPRLHRRNPKITLKKKKKKMELVDAFGRQRQANL